MCGICGILNYGNSVPSFDEPMLKRMTDVIAHRGPDDEGVFVSPGRNAGLGFRRLAIVDLSPAGHQPMFSPDGSIAIVFNGEIYNHLALRRELEAKGYVYRSRSDTETILYSYLEYGAEFVHRLLGMFALAIWDEPKKRLLVARDRIGIKPLYYTFASGNFIFGSEIKAILQHPAAPRSMNDEALGSYLTFLVPPAPMTLFKDIYKLEPGHRMIVEADGNVRKEQYWNPGGGPDQPSIGLDGVPIAGSSFLRDGSAATEQGAVGTIRTLLRQSISDRMMSDVPFGVFLSGGIDSSTNVALMAELMDRPVDTFTVGFRDLERYNELDHARLIAKQFRTNHHEVIIGEKEAFEFLPKLVFHQDEPLADPVCIPLYFVSKLARDNGTIVVQVGEGSDEQFAGYPWMLRDWNFYKTWWRMFGSLPQGIRNALYSAVAPSLRKQHQWLALDYLRRGRDNEELYWGGAINFTETHLDGLLTNAWRHRGRAGNAYAAPWHAEMHDRMPSADYLARMMYLEFRNRLPELLLMRVDKVSMATSIEARVPFLDHRLVEYSMTIPASLKFRNGETKYILKKAVEGIIPNEIIYRKKQGFAAPVTEWLRTSWGPFTEHKLLNSWFVREGVFDREFVRTMLRRHQSHSGSKGQNIWNLLNLVLWHEQWIEQRSFQ